MNSGLPSALIIGINHFVAKELAQRLVDKDIRVVGVGDYVSALNDLKNFEWASSLDEINGNFSYVFDFCGDKKDWEKIETEKFVLVSVNNKSRSLILDTEVENWSVDWRIIEATGVYGAGMGENDFLSKVIKQAVQNKNLELPSPKNTIRLLAIADLVEAILRSTFLSGTEREKFLVLGREIDFENLAKILMDKAKMTRFKVSEKEEVINQGDGERAKETERKLRWQASIEFDKGVEETLQYFFSKMDEENRMKKKIKSLPADSYAILAGKHLNGQEKEDKKNRMYDVAIEEDDYDQINPFIKKREPLEEVDQESEVIPKIIDFTVKPEKYDNEEKVKVEEKIEAKSEPEENEYIEDESDELFEVPKNDQKIEPKKVEEEKTIQADQV